MVKSPNENSHGIDGEVGTRAADASVRELSEAENMMQSKRTEEGKKNHNNWLHSSHYTKNNHITSLVAHADSVWIWWKLKMGSHSNFKDPAQNVLQFQGQSSSTGSS